MREQTAAVLITECRRGEGFARLCSPRGSLCQYLTVLPHSVTRMGPLPTAPENDGGGIESPPGSSHALSWLLQKLTLLWLEPGFKNPLCQRS